MVKLIEPPSSPDKAPVVEERAVLKINSVPWVLSWVSLKSKFDLGSVVPTPILALVKEVIKGGRATDDEYVHPLFQDEKKKKRLVKLIYKTQGKVLKEEKEIKEIKITVKDVKILAKEVLGINVTIL